MKKLKKKPVPKVSPLFILKWSAALLVFRFTYWPAAMFMLDYPSYVAKIIGMFMLGLPAAYVQIVVMHRICKEKKEIRFE